METECKHIKIPIWLATILVSVILGIAADTWRTVNCLKTDLRLLKTALAAKGIIDLSICKTDDPAANLTHFDHVLSNSAN